MSGDKVIRVGSRKSELALIQTHHVIDLLKKIHPEKTFEVVTMSTLGDKVLDTPLPKIGEKSLFTKELESALITGCVDFVVHSLKDLPTCLPEGMAIGAVLRREDPRDALVLRKDCQNLSLESLPEGSVVGTSSLRRTAQLSKIYPHLKIDNIRGNLNTRIRKLDELEMFHAIILAASGLKRMNWQHRISKILDEDQILYAVGQGALAVECRMDDVDTLNLLRDLYDTLTALAIIAERSFLRTLEGGCSAPVAVISNLNKIEDKYKIQLTGAVWSLDGQDEIKENDECFVKSDVVRTEGNVQLNSSEENGTKCPHKRSRGNGIEEGESSSKIQKLVSTEPSVEIFKHDFHEHCPVTLPVGVDFMGKCPYIESSPALTAALTNPDPRKCPVFAKFENDSTRMPTECPYVKEGKVQAVTVYDNYKTTNAAKLFVGLVAHPDVPAESFSAAEELGERLARKLIEKGARDIMAKAQAIIRSN